MTTAIAILAILAVAGLALVGVVRKLIHICQPNEVLVISGRSARGPGPRTYGYRLVQGGRGFVVPMLEKVDRLDLTNMIIDIEVRGAYSSGGIPLNVEGVANIKIASTQPTLGNAIERFLGRPRHEVMRVARETLEGNLRGVLATLTPEEVNRDRVKFAQSLLQEADGDLKKLGLVLDTLKIQNVSDDRGYLDSIGRKQSAELQMRSRVAEAENRALAAERSAENHREKETIRVAAEMELARAEADKRIVDAKTRRAALVAEQRAQVAALTAKATAELEVQKARTEQVPLQLIADRLRPAEARRDQLIAEARGQVAPIVEEGRATANALRHMTRTWRAHGDDAKRVFVAQKLESLVHHVMDTDLARPAPRIMMVDGALGDGLGAQAAVAARMLREAGGVSLGNLLGVGETGEERKIPSPPPLPAGVTPTRGKR